MWSYLLTNRIKHSTLEISALNSFGTDTELALHSENCVNIRL